MYWRCHLYLKVKDSDNRMVTQLTDHRYPQAVEASAFCHRSILHVLGMRKSSIRAGLSLTMSRSLSYLWLRTVYSWRRFHFACTVFGHTLVKTVGKGCVPSKCWVLCRLWSGECNFSNVMGWVLMLLPGWVRNSFIDPHSCTKLRAELITVFDG